MNLRMYGIEQGRDTACQWQGEPDSGQILPEYEMPMNIDAICNLCGVYRLYVVTLR